jgi:hypothetical protein
MTAVTLGTITLTGCETITENKNGNIIPLPIITLDSDTTELFDFLGVTEMFSVIGTFAGTTSTIRTTVNSIKALLNGNQTSTITFTDHTGTSFSVMIADATFTWQLPGNICRYDIKLFRGVAG